jgi:NAD(P)-dependent dehydrogenase (short-subunit alcohol dehydrogenase family)
MSYRTFETRGWAQATFLLHSRFEAMSAPARNVASLAHTTSSVTHSQPTKAGGLQSRSGEHPARNRTCVPRSETAGCRGASHQRVDAVASGSPLSFPAVPLGAAPRERHLFGSGTVFGSPGRPSRIPFYGGKIEKNGHQGAGQQPQPRRGRRGARRASAAARQVAYKATKAAMIAFTEQLALHNAPYGIRANCILPGLMDTPMAVE